MTDLRTSRVPDRVRSLTPHAATPTVDLLNVRRAFLHGCFAVPGTEAFLSARGRGVRSIVLGDNDFTDARTSFIVGKEVPARAVRGPK